MRVRGLKHYAIAGGLTACGSHPVRVRGLKPVPTKEPDVPDDVAPRAGAWIETGLTSKFIKRS